MQLQKIYIRLAETAVREICSSSFDASTKLVASKDCCDAQFLFQNFQKLLRRACHAAETDVIFTAFCIWLLILAIGHGSTQVFEEIICLRIPTPASEPTGVPCTV